MSNITMDQVAVIGCTMIFIIHSIIILIPCIVVELKISTYGEHRHIIAD